MQDIEIKKHEKIIFNGLPYRRYPESERRSDRVYFSSSRCKANGYKTQSLHKAIWESKNGKVPEGFHVHHNDNNPLNNDISNLSLFIGKEHLSKHAKEYHFEHKEKVAKHLEKVRPLASEWHRSEEGRKWHQKHAVQAYETMQPKEQICQHCSKVYIRDKPMGKGLFCSNACRSAFRNSSGKDDIVRKCLVCNKEFKTNKYSTIKTCGRSCGCKYGYSVRKSL